MEALEDEGTILVDLTGVRFAEPYSGPVMAELQRRGIPFVSDDEGMVRQLGDGRRLRGDAQRLLFRQGDAALKAQDGARRVVFVEGLSPAEKQEHRDLRRDILRHLRANPLELTDQGRGVLERPDHEISRNLVAEQNVSGLEAFGGLRFLIENDLMEVDPDWQDRFDRYAELENRWNQRTLGLFLAPLGQRPS
jgi:hypothetical protein